MHHPEMDGILRDLVSKIHQTLGENLVGIYLYGSLTAEDFDVESSDIDLMVATKLTVSGAEFLRLREMHTAFAKEHIAWDDRVDAVYLPASGLQTILSRNTPAAYISPGEPLHMLDVGKDWLMDWYNVRRTGIALVGPPATTVVEPISSHEFIQAARAYTIAWSERVHHAHNRKSQAFAVLTLCRCLYVHVHGEQTSKHQAALWAQTQLPEWSSLIEDALNWRATWRTQRPP